MRKASNAPSGLIKLTDLADHLGLDKSTVSRALNQRPGVAVETQERILRVARELGYSPNVHGQQLRGWKSTTLSRAERTEIRVPTELMIRSSSAPPNGPSTGKANQR